MLLAYRIKKNMQLARDAAKQDQMANAEANIMAARAAEEEKRKTAQIQAQVEIAKINAEKEKEAALLILEFALKGQNELPKLASKEKIAELAQEHERNMAAFNKS
jgi:hemolysin activation/secretion protein